MSEIKFELPAENFIDRVVGFVSPSSALRRREARMRMSYLNTITPLKSNRRSKSRHTSKNARGEDIISARDRKYLHSLVRVMAKENPLLAGAINTMVNNVVPPGGILPNPTTDDKQFNRDAEDYYLERAEKCEITNRFSIEQYQKIMLTRTLADGDFLTVFTNQRRIQGIEAERLITPQVYQGEEGETIFQGVKVNPFGAPITYYVGCRDRSGNIKAADHRGVQARNCHHAFITDRMEEYRGSSVFLPVLDHFRDIQDIIAYEKFVMKMAACVGIKISPMEDSKGGGLPFPTKNTTTGADGKQQVIKEMFPGQVFDLGKMGAGNIEIVESNRPGSNFETMMALLARIAGVGINLPIELILLDFNRGNMASVRAALLEARKTFYAHYAHVKSFSTQYYRWVISQGISDGILKPPASVVKRCLKVEWSEPVWNWLDPLKEIQAEGLAIAYGFKTYEDVAKQRGKDWAQIAKKLGEQQAEFEKNNAKIILGQPGATILGEDDESNKGEK